MINFSHHEAPFRPSLASKNAALDATALLSTPADFQCRAVDIHKGREMR